MGKVTYWVNINIWICIIVVELIALKEALHVDSLLSRSIEEFASDMMCGTEFGF